MAGITKPKLPLAFPFILCRVAVVKVKELPEPFEVLPPGFALRLVQNSRDFLFHHTEFGQEPGAHLAAKTMHRIEPLPEDPLDPAALSFSQIQPPLEMFKGVGVHGVGVADAVQKELASDNGRSRCADQHAAEEKEKSQEKAVDT